MRQERQTILREYQVANFKAFAGPVTVPSRPITLIYGANSSGKSSLLQSLLICKQTLEEAENAETILLSKGSLVDLGGPREFLHRHEPDREFRLRFTFDPARFMEDGPPWLTHFIHLIQPAGLSLELAFHLDSDSGNIALREVAVYTGHQDAPLYRYRSEPLPERSRLRRRLRYEIGFATGTPPRFVLRLADLNKQHPAWRLVWDDLLRTFIPNATRQLEKYRDQLAKDLDRLRPQVAAALDPALMDVPRAPRRRSRRSLTDLEGDLVQATELLAKYSNYSLDVALNDFETDNSSSRLICRHFLPASAAELSDTPSATPFDLHPEYFSPFHFRTRSGFPDLAWFTMHLSSLVRHTLESIIYLGPLRDYPERHYIFSGNIAQHVGKSGKMVPDILFKNRSLLKRVNEELDRFGLNYELRVSSVSEDTIELRDVFALRLYDKATDVNASILDVGFGISQVLPVIVQSMLSTQKTLCVEQPEIHLHPRLQADLGTLFARCIKPPYDNRFLIETHSEHLMLRLQRLVRERQLTPEDIAVVYVDRTPRGAQCLSLRLDEDGDFIDEWPGGFFEEGYREIFR